MEYKLIAKLFNSSELKKVASGNLNSIYKVLNSYSELKYATNVSEFYEEAYKLLIKHYRNEYVVKNEIANKILLGRHSLNTTAMMSELRTGNSIADCLVLNGYSTCYEIKTEMDSLVRFQGQLESYLKAYDKTYIVTHKTHLHHILSMHEQSPSFGILELTSRNSLREIKKAPISEEFDFEIAFDTLRKPEYCYIAKQVQGTIPEMPNTKLYEYCRKVFFSLSSQEANNLFKESLKLFRANDHIFINSLPKPLKNIGISYQLSRKEKNNLVCSLMTNIHTTSGDNNVFSIHEGKTARTFSPT